MCNHTPSFLAAHYLTRALGRKEKLCSIINRGGGWPGFMTVTTESAKQGFYPFRRTWPAGYGIYFKNDRCELCNDPFAKNADIVMGDAYPLHATDNKGTTYAIVRNDQIYGILQEMRAENIISLEEGPTEKEKKQYFSDLYKREEEYPLKWAMYKQIRGGRIEASPISEVNLRYNWKELISFRILLLKNKLGQYIFLWPLLIFRHHLKSIIKIHGN